MNQPNFTQAALAAFVIAAISAAIILVLPMTGFGWQLTREMVSLTGVLLAPGAWLLFLLRHASHRSGRLAFAMGWLVISGSSVLVSSDPIELMFVQLALVWLARTVFYHRQIRGALIDGALTLFSALLAGMAFVHSGSIFLTLWTLFLIQALFIWIPRRQEAEIRSADDEPMQANTQFETAWRNAQSALRSMADEQTT